MKVFQITVRVKLKQNIPYEDALASIATLLDKNLCKSGHQELHNKNEYKNYCFNSLYPIEPSRFYQAAKIYTFQIRTISSDIATIFTSSLLNESSRLFTVLEIQSKIILKHPIEKIHSITPCIMKNDYGYWKIDDNDDNVQIFEERLKDNLIKKYNNFTGAFMDEDFKLCNSIKFLNKVPITCNYKSIHLLGDKVEIIPDVSKEAQELFHMAIGTGILESNARGFGYINFQWKK